MAKGDIFKNVCVYKFKVIEFTNVSDNLAQTEKKHCL